jgi:hypothetical protein
MISSNCLFLCRENYQAINIIKIPWLNKYHARYSLLSDRLHQLNQLYVISVCTNQTKLDGNENHGLTVHLNTSEDYVNTVSDVGWTQGLSPGGAFSGRRFRDRRDTRVYTVIVQIPGIFMIIESRVRFLFCNIAKSANDKLSVIRAPRTIARSPRTWSKRSIWYHKRPDLDGNILRFPG